MCCKSIGVNKQIINVLFAEGIEQKIADIDAPSVPVVPPVV